MSYCANERIKWIFNPPVSPWMGGFLESKPHELLPLRFSVEKASKFWECWKYEYLTSATILPRIDLTRPANERKLALWQNQ
ncbi:hypothetical protein OSTOST_02960 [Ostertagia ostertagi]